MKVDQTSKIQFKFLQALSTSHAMNLALGQNFDLQQYQKYKKQLCQKVYLIQISHQDQHWILVKTNRQCQYLFHQIYDSQEQINRFVKKIEDYFLHLLPFQHKNQFSDNDIIQQLNFLGQRPDILKNSYFIKFIEFNNIHQRYIYRKFTMIKKNGGRYKEGCCRMGSLWTQWKKRQVSIQFNGITYKNQLGQMKEYLPFSHGFEYFFGKAQTSSSLGIILVSNHRRLVLEAQNIEDYVLFLYILKKKTMQSPYLNINRFNSFAPVRQFVKSQLYIDGKDYFNALYESLLNAKRSIYMTGWMISPQFLLKRKPKNVSLLDIIKKKVDEGLQINILVYHQSSFLPNDSLYVKEKFQALGHRVKVIRHPTGKLPILWSHHSKMVIIDKEQAFFGGLDLCYGRYDCQLHELFPQTYSETYPGIEYNNCRLKDIDNIRCFTIDHIDKRHPRLPWHDICQSVKGIIVSDFVHHFVEIWNFASYENREVLNNQIINVPAQIQIKTIQNLMSTKQSQLEYGGDEKEKKKKYHKILTSLTNTFEQVKNKGKQSLKQSLNLIKQKIYPDKKSLQQLYRKKKISAAENNFQTYISGVSKQIQKMKRYRNVEDNKQNQQQKIQNVNSQLNEESKTNINKDNKSRFFGQRNMKKQSISQGQIVVEMDQDIDSEQEAPGKIWENKPYNQYDLQGANQCQLLRSVGNWSIGCSAQKPQFSIHISYLQLISQAQHYIYIQNQFFISSTTETSQVKNEICNALYRRIKIAIQQREEFKVFVMLPLLPAFAGDLQQDECTFLRMIMDWQYKTIKNLVNRITALGVDYADYIQFLGLRTHGISYQGTPSTQIVYVHSKMMIVDDLVTIVGSANINDRSLLGDRDSQIAVVTYGMDLVKGQMNGHKATVSSKIRQFRVKLWKQHFNLPIQLIQDPSSSQLWSKVKQISSRNTCIYRKVFGCYPDNQMKSLSQLKQIKDKSLIQRYFQEIDKVCGNVTEYPFQFLQKQPIQSSVISKEYFIPTECLV